MTCVLIMALASLFAMTSFIIFDTTWEDHRRCASHRLVPSSNGLMSSEQLGRALVMELTNKPAGPPRSVSCSFGMSLNSSTPAAVAASNGLSCSDQLGRAVVTELSNKPAGPPRSVACSFGMSLNSSTLAARVLHAHAGVPYTT